MTHRFFVAPSQVAGGTITFTTKQSHQLRHVLRLRPGDEVRTFDGIGDCDLVVELDAAFAGKVVGEMPFAPEPRTRLSVYPALLQRDKFESVLQKLTELGVSSITPVMTTRGLVRAAPDAPRLARWQAIVIEAAEQSGRGRIPEIRGVLRFEQAVRSAAGLRLVACEGERQTLLRDALSGRPEEVAVFVGPEGGFTPEEMSCARALGANVITLGPRVLRTETASPVVAALVLYELGDLSWPLSEP
jgi:16S rRNA (uracil1498-N3)-methyltransferase